MTEKIALVILFSTTEQKAKYEKNTNNNSGYTCVYQCTSHDTGKGVTLNMADYRVVHRLAQDTDKQQQ